MRARFGRLAGLVVMVVSASTECASAASSDVGVLRLLVHASGTASAETVIGARETVARIYRELGVAVEWIRVDEGVAPERPGTLAIHLLIRPTAAGISSNAAAWARALTAPHQNDGTILVFFDRVVRGAHRYKQPPGVLLGYTLAHEIGHILLPFPAHAATGIMRADWDGDDIRCLASGSLTFTPAQVDLIRAKLASCCSPFLVTPVTRER